MALEISLAQFNKIATGDYNAGQIDIKVGDNGQAELVKINNHVWRTSKNNVVLSPERILEVKEAFLNALAKGGVRAEDLKEVRDRLGLPDELDVASGNDKDQRTGILKARFSPLTRAQVRSILDEYANQGKGFTRASANDISYEDWQAGQRTANMSAGRMADRDKVNMEAQNMHEKRGGAGVNYGITDAISLLSTSRTLANLGAAQNCREKGDNAVNERILKRTALVNGFQGLVSQALKMLSAGTRDSGEFRLAGETVKLVKGDDGSLTAIVGKGALATKVKLGADADTYIARLLGRAVADMDTLGAPAMKNILGAVYDRDLEGGLVASERTSLTRQLSALVLANKSGGKVDMDALVKGSYNTGILVEMAERAIDGEDIGDSKAKLDAYHEKLKSDNAGLPEEMKAMLEKVANVPLEKPDAGDGEFVVKAPITGDIDNVVKAMPPPVPGPIATVPRDIGGIDGIKDFVASLVFSDDTMVGDVTVNKPGEAMRKMLANDRNVIALAEIIKNPAILDLACAPQIADAVKDGLGKMVDILDAAFRSANNGKSLAVAATEKDFVAQLSLFLQGPGKLPGAELAKFDNLILSMANKGCENIQLFINDVFKVGNANVNAQGGIVGDPYKNLSADEIKAQLNGKGLNDILDTAANSDSPGQVGFFRQVISTYFTSLSKADKRSCFAAAMKYAKSFDFAGLQGEARVSAQKAAVNKFTGAILKGTSPLLQKMMQGLPRDIMGDYADALEDMKSSLAPIPRKIVQAHFMQMIEESKGKGAGKEIESIELKKSLGAASVGEAFLCSFKIKGEERPRQFVVKIMRHDAERRVNAEAEIFTEAAKKIGPGMAKTWEGQLKQYMTEFDFRNEAKNVNEGVKLYDIANTEGHPLRLITKRVESMKLSTVVAPKKDVMVAEVARGKPVDKFFKTKISEIRNAASAVFEQDPSTGRIKWKNGPVDPKTGKPKQVPVVKPNVTGGEINNMINWCRTNYSDIKEAQQLLVQATKVWFHEALLGSGKFHGDTHAGNLMVAPGGITFIDFGNLYELKTHYVLDAQGNQVMETVQEENEEGQMVEVQRPKVLLDERHELLRIIMGAAFRDRTFFLDGLEKLLSPEGKAALKANRAKAEAILDTILSKGRFSYDMVYRLNAAVTELQKLGLELPPQINCFVQSMARLSNTLSEMNTIVNQTSLLLETADDFVRQEPAPERDELDIVGMAFDYRTSAEGRQKVDDDINVATVELNGNPVPVSSYLHRLADKTGFGGFPLDTSASLMTGGAYFNKVLDRLEKSQDPVAEARKLNNMLRANLDTAHNESFKVQVDVLDGELLEKLRTDLAAAQTPDAKTKALKAYAASYTRAVKAVMDGIVENEQQLVSMRTFETTQKPASFANAVMSTLMDNFDALSTTFANSKTKLMIDVKAISMKELGLGLFSGEQTIVKAVKDDALKMAGDDSYQVDIGV